MKTTREKLPEVYRNMTEGDRKFWPEKYIQHGGLVECNFGGKVVTLSNTGEAVFVVSDWSGDDIIVNGIFEVEFFEDPEDIDLSGDGFRVGDTVYMLHNFMSIR